MEHLSVKPGPKRLNFYGQTAFFDLFVRNHYFSSRLFTDSMPIFIDVSVNDSDFAKCRIRPVKFATKLFLLISIMADDCHAYAKTRTICS